MAERWNDSQCAVELVENSGIDSHEIFRHLASTVITGNKARDDVVREIRKGRKRWKEKNGNGKRWHVERFFSSFKRWSGK